MPNKDEKWHTTPVDEHGRTDDKKYVCHVCGRAYIGRKAVKYALVRYEIKRPVFGLPQVVTVCSPHIGKDNDYGKPCRDAIEAQGYRQQFTKEGGLRYV